MTAQAFFYNAIFFTYALVLTKFYDIPRRSAGTCCRSRLAISSVRCCWGGYSTRSGRKPMITATYVSPVCCWR